VTVSGADISEYVGLGIQENGEYCRVGGAVPGCDDPGMFYLFILFIYFIYLFYLFILFIYLFYIILYYFILFYIILYYFILFYIILIIYIILYCFVICLLFYFLFFIFILYSLSCVFIIYLDNAGMQLWINNNNCADFSLANPFYCGSNPPNAKNIVHVQMSGVYPHCVATLTRLSTAPKCQYSC
jgi:hypothetical protein